MASEPAASSIEIGGYSDIRCRFDSTRVVCALRVDTENPFFEGHFPGNPVLPAIAQLVLVERLIGEAMGSDVAVDSLSQVRFAEVIRPGDRLTVEVNGLGREATESFRILRQQTLATAGKLTLRRDRSGE